MLYTTFSLLRQNGACAKAYRKVAKALGGIKKYGRDTPIYIDRWIDLAGLSNSLWALRTVPVEQAADRDRISRLLACRYACDVLPMYEAILPRDMRPRMAIETAALYADGLASDGELFAAGSSANDAAWSAPCPPARTAAMAAAESTAWNAAMAVVWTNLFAAFGKLQVEHFKEVMIV